MKVVVLGGAGDVGSRTVEALLDAADVEQVTIGDRDVAAAERVAQGLRGRGAELRVVPLDARDHGAVVAALRGHDVVASTLGPFFEFEPRLVAAALDAGVDYASVCDDFSAAEVVLERFDAPAKAAGVVVLTGLGTSPGLSNVGIRYFADQMDRVQRAEVSVYQPLDAGGGEAVLRHMLYIISGEVAAWRDGRAQRIPACSETRLVEFPRFGARPVWNMGHAEPVTVPRFIEGIEECMYYMGFGRGSGWFIHPARLGLFQVPAIVELVVKAAVYLEGRGERKPPAHGALRLDVFGERDGKPVHRMACGTGEMREVTGVSLAVGTLMLARRQLTFSGPGGPAGGVFAPEACLDPRAFLGELYRYGIDAFEDLEMTRSLSAQLA